MSKSQGNGEGATLDVATALGAEPGVSIQSFAVYIPNKDRTGCEIGNQRQWVREALELLGKIGGGATAMPPVEGTWLDEQGQFLWENPVVVYTYINEDAFAANLSNLREFLHRMGRQTKQGEVAFEFGNRFFRIRKFDSEERSDV